MARHSGNLAGRRFRWLPKLLSIAILAAALAVVGATVRVSPVTAEAAPQDCSSRFDGVDVGFAVDRSGSMAGNDPQNLRIDAVKAFIDAMRGSDKGVVVPFEGSASPKPLIPTDSSVHRAELKVQADAASGDGGGTAIDQGYLATKTSLGPVVQGRGRVIIILTDGDGSTWSGTQIGQDASDNQIVIYTVGLGSVNEQFLRDIASTSGGTYSHLTSASDLTDLYLRIAGDVQDPTCDRVGSVHNGVGHADPVDVATGNFYIEETDLAPPGGVTGLASISRRHNSLSAGAGQTGPRWLGSFDARVAVAPNDGRGLYDSDGGVLLYQSNGSGGWTRPTTGSGELTFASNTYTLKRIDGSIDTYDSNGRLTSRKDPSGVVVSVSRNTEGYISSIATGLYTVTFEDTRRLDSSGTDVAGSDGLVDRAVTSDGRVVRYSYGLDPITGRTVLTKASAPHTAAEDSVAPAPYGEHRYVVSNGRIIEEWERLSETKERRLVANTLDSQGRVLSQVTDTGDTAQFNYGMKPGAGTMLDPAPGYTTVVDSASGDVTVYRYDELGQVVAITDAAGLPTTRGYQNEAPSTGTSRSGVVTTVARDAAGRPTNSMATAAGGGSRALRSLTYTVPETDPAATTDLRVASMTEAGVTKTYLYDDPQNKQQPTKVSIPCDPASLKTGVSCPSSGKSDTTYAYYSGDQAGLVKDLTDPDGVKTSFTYHADRTLASVSKAPSGGVVLTLTYDSFRPGQTGFPSNAPVGTAIARRMVSANGNSTAAAGDGTSWTFEDARQHVLENP